MKAVVNSKKYFGSDGKQVTEMQHKFANLQADDDETKTNENFMSNLKNKLKVNEKEDKQSQK